MAAIYLKHEIHGTKVACSDMEAEYDEKNGWVRYNTDTQPTPVEAAPVSDAKSIEELREMWELKYGTKPHHKKSAETLRKELE